MLQDKPNKLAPVGRWDKDHVLVSLLAGFSLEAVGHLACTSSTPDIAGEDLLEIGVPFSDTACT